MLTIAIDLAMIAVLLIIHFFYKQKGKNKKIIHWILWLLTVLFIFWMVQIIAVELIIPGASEPSVRTLRATIPENESRQIF